MSTWNLGSEQNPDGSRDVTIAFSNDDSNGQMSGTLPGRNYSAFALWGSNQQGATVYVAAAGTMVGPGTAPQSIDLNLIRASTIDDEQYGWDGKLLPI